MIEDFEETLNMPLDHQTGEQEAEQRALGLVMLVSYRKYQTIPSFAVPSFIGEKLLTLYQVEDDPLLQGVPFIRFTYKGRRVAEKCYKIFKQEGTWQGGEPVDMYLNHQVGDDGLFLMHHKRYLMELNAQQRDRLNAIYHSTFDNV